MTDPEPAVELPARDADGAARRLGSSRPELDHFVRAVLRARAAAELFGEQPAVQVGRYELRRHVGTGGGGSVFVAWDPELAREVALKLIAAPDPRLRKRALAEGQALAQLSHPNIVPVFDVGVIDERIYLVMELIRGTSLRDYVRDARPRDIVLAYRQCALGLAAAHAAKLVHRDFKPDNAVIDRDARVRVIDFGLALDEAAAGDADSSGTPAYMAPEQQRGEPVSAAVDQYALAVSLREALTPTPSWLERIIARATAEDPGERFPSMGVLEAALSRDPASRWRRRAFVVAPLAIAVAAYGIGQARESAPSPCANEDGLVDVWSPTRRASLVGHLEALATPYAKLAITRLDAIDRYASGWQTSSHAGCLAHQSGELSSATYDRRQVCLASARTQLAQLVDSGLVVTADKLDKLVRAVPELPDVASCADVAALTIEAPPSQAQESRARELRQRLDRARVKMQAGDDVDAELDSLVTASRALGYRPLVGDALLLQGTALLQQWQFIPAVGPLEAAYTEQLRSGDYRDAVEAYARYAWVRSRIVDHPEQALDGIEHVEPLAEGLPSHARFAQALLHNNLGSIHMTAGDNVRARTEFAVAVALATQVTGPGSIELGVGLENLALVTDDPDRQRALLDGRIARLVTALGADHPLTLNAKSIAALARPDPQQARAALADSCDRLASLHPSYTTKIGGCAFELGWLELMLDRRDDARRHLELSATELHLTSPSRSNAYLDLASGKRASAAEQFRVMIAKQPSDPEAPWFARAELGDLYLGEALSSEGDEARRAFASARRELEAAYAVRRWSRLRWRLDWLAALAH